MCYVWEKSHEASTLDSSAQLALVAGLGAGQTSRHDLGVFLDELFQDIHILVVDLFDAGHCEAAETLALEQQRLGVALGALVFVEFFERGHGAS